VGRRRRVAPAHDASVPDFQRFRDIAEASTVRSQALRPDVSNLDVPETLPDDRFSFGRRAISTRCAVTNAVPILAARSVDAQPAAA